MQINGDRPLQISSKIDRVNSVQTQYQKESPLTIKLSPNLRLNQTELVSNHLPLIFFNKSRGCELERFSSIT